MSDGAPILTPSDVTVGSNAQVLYRFTGALPPFEKAVLTEHDEALQRVNASGLYTIQSARLEKSGGVATVVLDIIPWKSGELVIEPIVFCVPSPRGETAKGNGETTTVGATAAATENSENGASGSETLTDTAAVVAEANAETQTANAAHTETLAEPTTAGAAATQSATLAATIQTDTFTVTVPPLFIQSVIGINAETQSLAPPAPPVVIPGTTYAVYAVVIGVVVAVFLVVSFLSRLQKIRSAFSAFFDAVLQRRNYRRLVRTVKKLLRKKNPPDSVTATTVLVHAFKVYLEKRFTYPFTARVTAEIVTQLTKMYPNHTQEINAVQKSLSRCDFVRFSAHGNAVAAVQGAQLGASAAPSAQSGVTARGLMSNGAQSNIPGSQSTIPSGAQSGVTARGLMSNVAEPNILGSQSTIQNGAQVAIPGTDVGASSCDSLSNRTQQPTSSDSFQTFDLKSVSAPILACAALFEKEETDVPY